MQGEGGPYTTRELSVETWGDFERLFETHPAPGAYPCWCMFNHRTLPERREAKTSAERTAINHREKKKLVQQGCAHGIIVYAEGEPVGWCQYGPAEELPRIETSPAYRKVATEDRGRPLWRITCFVVRRPYRERGVASTGLRAALEAILEKGGGLVEAYPITRRGAYSEYRGTLSMFRTAGFEVVARLGKDNVLVRRTI